MSTWKAVEFGGRWYLVASGFVIGGPRSRREAEKAAEHHNERDAKDDLWGKQKKHIEAYIREQKL